MAEKVGLPQKNVEERAAGKGRGYRIERGDFTMQVYEKKSGGKTFPGSQENALGEGTKKGGTMHQRKTVFKRLIVIVWNQKRRMRSMGRGRGPPRGLFLKKKNLGRGIIQSLSIFGGGGVPPRGGKGSGLEGLWSQKGNY